MGEPSLTVAQMREADRRAIEVLGIPSVVLMERAGLAVFERLPKEKPVTIVCGKGNNGGDGFVAGRLALLAGHSTRIIVLADMAELAPDAQTFAKVYTELYGELIVCHDEDTLIEAFSSTPSGSTLVDCMLGTGTRGEVTGIVRCAIDHWPEGYTIAVDIPSGINGDSGEVCGVAIRADETVTLQFLKRGFVNPDASVWLGRVHVADIGIPAVCGDDILWTKRGISA
jgi:hydroxyethylthiazole kinase-like uncharacterized protein yjeF